MVDSPRILGLCTIERQPRQLCCKRNPGFSTNEACAAGTTGRTSSVSMPFESNHHGKGPHDFSSKVVCVRQRLRDQEEDKQEKLILVVTSSASGTCHLYYLFVLFDVRCPRCTLHTYMRMIPHLCHVIPVSKYFHSGKYCDQC